MWVANIVWHAKFRILDLTRDDVGHEEHEGLWDMAYGMDRMYAARGVPVRERDLQCGGACQEAGVEAAMFLRVRHTASSASPGRCRAFPPRRVRRLDRACGAAFFGSVASGVLPRREILLKRGITMSLLGLGERAEWQSKNSRLAQRRRHRWIRQAGDLEVRPAGRDPAARQARWYLPG